MSELLLCALLRRGKAGTAAEIMDDANAIAADAGYPKPGWILSAKSAAKLLAHMERRRLVKKSAQTQRENGVDRLLWLPTAPFDAAAPVPEYKLDEQKKHPLDDMSKPQIYTLVEVLQEMNRDGYRQRREIGALLVRQLEEFERTVERAKRQLLASGLAGEL